MRSSKPQAYQGIFRVRISRRGMRYDSEVAQATLSVTGTLVSWKRICGPVELEHSTTDPMSHCIPRYRQIPRYAAIFRIRPNRILPRVRWKFWRSVRSKFYRLKAYDAARQRMMPSLQGQDINPWLPRSAEMINIALSVGGFVLLKGLFLMLFAQEHRRIGPISQSDASNPLHPRSQRPQQRGVQRVRWERCRGLSGTCLIESPLDAWREGSCRRRDS